MAINWSKQIKPGSRLAHAGVYCLRTNATKCNNARPWRTCSMLTDLEAVFHSLRSERGLRRVTASFPRADGGALQGRKATRPETELAAIFHALGVDPLPESHRNYSPIVKKGPMVVCGGSVFGRDAKVKPAGMYSRRLPEQTTHRSPSSYKPSSLEIHPKNSL